MKRLIFLFAALLALSVPALADEKSERAFAADMRHRIKVERPEWKVEVDPEMPLRLSVKTDQGDSRGLMLYSLYDYCQQAAEEDCETAKAHYAETMTDDAPPITADGLRYVVRGPDYVDNVEDLGRKSGRRMAYYRQIGDDLYLFLVADSPTQFAYIGDAAMEKIGLRNEQQAWDLASAHMKKRMLPLPSPEELKRGPMALAGDDYVTAMLADSARWNQLAGKVGADLYMSVPSDSMVVVGLLPDGPGLDKAANYAAEMCRTSQRCISRHVYRWRSGKWVIVR